MKKFCKIYTAINLIIIIAIILTGVVNYMIGKIMIGICAGFFISGVFKLIDREN